MFHHFRFTAQFLPEAPREKENIHFSELIRTRFVSNPNENSFHIQTTKGKVVVTEEMRDFGDIVELISSLAEANLTSRRECDETLKEAPKIQTPLYGWLILAFAVACAAVAGWYFMYRTN